MVKMTFNLFKGHGNHEYRKTNQFNIYTQEGARVTPTCKRKNLQIEKIARNPRKIFKI